MLLKKKKVQSENDKYSEQLLCLIKEKGVLVKIMSKGTSFLLDTHTEYKKNLGAVSIKDKKGNVTNVYVAYEDFDGSIKYFDYPEYTQKEIKKLRVEHDGKYQNFDTHLGRTGTGMSFLQKSEMVRNAKSKTRKD